MVCDGDRPSGLVCSLLCLLLQHQGFPVLLRRGNVGELHRFVEVVLHHLLDLIQGDPEEFPAGVDKVQLPVGKGLVSAASSLGASSEKIMAWTSKSKGTEASPKLVHPVHGVQTAGHADLIHVLAEGADVGNNIDVPGPLVGRPIVHVP